MQSGRCRSNEVVPMNIQNLSSTDHHPRRRIKVLDTEMSYVDTGSGDPIGNALQAFVKGLQA
jgi:hypothetical protein